MYLGDFNQNQTVNSQFTSVNANGTPTTLANGSLAVYKNNNTTERTANLTLSADFDGRTGLNNVNIDMSLNTSFYASGNDFTCVLAAGDIAGVTVLGNSTLFSWSVNNRAGSLSSDATLMLGINSNVSQTLTHAANANTSASSANTQASNANTTSVSINTTVVAMNTTLGTVNTHASNANTSASNANTSATNTNTTINGANGIETGVSFKSSQRLIMASTSGLLDGAGTGTITLTDHSGNVTVMSVTADGNGNRTAITYNTSY